MSSRQIPISKENLEKILRPITKISESCVLRGKDDSISTVCATPDVSVIIYGRLKISPPLHEPLRLNLISIKKFLSGLNSIGSDGIFSLTLENNYIKCEIKKDNQKTHLKYHLVDDDIIKEFPVNIEKIKNLSFDTDFLLSPDVTKKILSASSFATEAQKVYFSLEDNIINAEINDATIPNIDSMVIPITDKWTGDDIVTNIPLSMEVFKNLLSFKNNIRVRINNTKKVVVFETIEDDLLELKYIVSALNK